MGMSDAEVFDAMAGALQERGLATTEQVAADRAVQPFNTSTETAVKTVDTTNLPADEVDPAMEQIDQDVFAGPASPDGYRFIAPPNGISRDVAQEQATAQAFHEIGLPVSISQQANRLYFDALQSPPTAEQLESSRQQAHVQLTRQFGDDTPKIIATAQAEFARMVAKAPHLKELADVSGLGNNPMLIASLYHNAIAKGRGPK